jgi:hypothetical protein
MILTPLISLIPLIFCLFAASLHITLAVSVYKDATTREREGRGPLFIGPRAWCIAALLSGIVGLLVYWLMHCSTLAATGKMN